jgi:hypothetical protein
MDEAETWEKCKFNVKIRCLCKAAAQRNHIEVARHIL